MNGMTETVTLESGENNDDLDAGLYRPASLGDFVFEDTDGDGIQDAGEPGIPNVTVNLKDENGNVIASTTTAGDGSYSFDNLEPGDYSVQFVLIPDYTFTTLNAGGDEALDSDADPAMNGMTETVTLESGDDNDDLDAGLQRDAEVTLEKTFQYATANGDGTYEVRYTVTVTNAGGIGQYTLRDTPSFDNDVTIISGLFSGEATGTLNTVGATTLVTNNEIAADATETFILTYQVRLELNADNPDGGDNTYTPCGSGGPNGNGMPGEGLYNLAEIDTDGDNIFDDSDDDCGDLPLFDLALTKVVTSGSTYGQGSLVTYEVVVTNEGEIDANNIVVTDTPDAGLVFGSITPQTGITGLGNGSFQIASLPVGQSVTVELNYTISGTFQGNTLTNAAEITEDGPYDDVDSDPDFGPDVDEDGDGDGDDDDEDNATITIEQTYDLALTKDLASANTTPIAQGTELTYTITVTNEGSLNASNVEVTDRPGAGLSYVGENLPAGVTGSNGVYVIASLLQGESISFEVTYAIDATFQGSSVRNEAEITEDDGDDEDSTPDNDDDTEDDQDDVETPIEQTYDLALTKDLASANTTPIVQGTELTYTITVTNEGSLNASNVEVTDRPGAGLSYVGENLPAG
ncbi:DUF11 domain-containing protein, partial [Lewinella sp. W8]|nr:DUF11 domain-containing protein [Lewinella sp. W8]